MREGDRLLAPAAEALGRGRVGTQSLYAVALGAGLLLLLGVPFVGSGYVVRFLTELFMLIVLAQAWNLIGGLSGYISFGHVVFFGLGAYTTGLLMERLGMPFFVALGGGMGLAVLFAVLIGLPILRLRGHYFAIATFGVAEGMRQIVTTASGLTGGGMGLNVPPLRPPPWLAAALGGNVAAGSALFYYLMLALLVATMLATWQVMRRRLGFGLRAIRADEDAAAVLGVDCTRYKTIAFALSALFPALAGGIYAVWFSYIDPVTVFGLNFSVTMVIMTLLGGIGTLWGPVVGGVVLTLIGEVLWGKFLELHSAFLGAVLVVVVIFLPRGIVATLRGGRRALSPAAIRRNLRRYSV
jgi:branched-chain amino acid transport system permease protein